MSRTEAALADLLGGPLVTGATREAMTPRMAGEVGAHTPFSPSLFSSAEYALLQAVAVRLVPHDPVAMPLAQRIDARLARGDADGWRYDALPPDADAYRELLKALPKDFLATSEQGQTAALVQIQQTHPRHFEELLAELTEGYYSQPEAQLNIGYVGFADAAGWTRIGLDQLDPNEAQALHTAGLEPL